MNIRELIPKYKDDFKRIEILNTYSVEMLKPIIPDLLEWQQDMNWPIAFEVKKILLKFNEDLIPHIRNILMSKDGDWKFFILDHLLRDLPDNILIMIKPDLERIRDNPTDDEKLLDLNEMVEELLQRLMCS